MAVVKKKNASTNAIRNISWKELFITGSVTLNIAFFVLFVAMAVTPVFDQVYLSVGAERLCSSANDSKFQSASAQSQAYRNYMCARDDAKDYYTEGLKQYLDAKGVRYGE